MRRLKALFKSIGFFTKFTLFLGVFCIFIGIFLICFSFRYEVLDDKYLIISNKEYKSNSNISLKKGEISVLADTKYIRDGIYKITFSSFSGKQDKNKIIKDETVLTITNILGEGYKLFEKEITINGKDYDFNKMINSEESIKFEYQNDSVVITIPNNLVSKKNIITFYIKLTTRELNKKHITTRDAYYSFVPDESNNFYEKSGYQSYIIYGNGYIKLVKK